MNNRIRCLITVSTLLAACSCGSATGTTPGSATGAAGAGLPAGGADGALIVPMSMVIPKKAVTPPASTVPTATGAAGARAPIQRGFPGQGAMGMGAPTATSGLPGAGAAGGGANGISMAAAGSGAGAVTAEPSATGDRATPEGVCARWKADRADLAEGTWTGNAASCEVGDMAPTAIKYDVQVVDCK